MQPDHYTAKKHLQELRKSEFEAFVDEFLFSDAEKEILHKIYVEKLPLWKVGECCGYSESGVKKIHEKKKKKRDIELIEV